MSASQNTPAGRIGARGAIGGSRYRAVGNIEGTSRKVLEVDRPTDIV
jgi:hypothetical protein